MKIDLYRCAPLSALITQRQCEINRLTIIGCGRCAGLGGLVETVDGTECEKSAKPGNWASQSISRKGAESRKVTLRRLAAPAEDAVGEYTCIDLVDTPDSFVVTFDGLDPDDLQLLRKIEQIAYEHGSTLGDEIMVRLQVLEAEL